MAPLWPYTVNTVVTIDSGNPNLVDMTDYSSSAPVGSGPTVQSQVLWGMSGLANTEHTVVFSMMSGGRYVVVDALVYDLNPFLDIALFSSPLKLYCFRPLAYFRSRSFLYTYTFPRVHTLFCIYHTALQFQP